MDAVWAEFGKWLVAITGLFAMAKQATEGYKLYQSTRTDHTSVIISQYRQMLTDLQGQYNNMVTQLTAKDAEFAKRLQEYRTESETRIAQLTTDLQKTNSDLQAARNTIIDLTMKVNMIEQRRMPAS